MRRSRHYLLVARHKNVRNVRGGTRASREEEEGEEKHTHPKREVRKA